MLRSRSAPRSGWGGDRTERVRASGSALGRHLGRDKGCGCTLPSIWEFTDIQML